ncbi:MAG: NFACT RNA binding domain-containing protein [Candidatus Woesearchaeota archaeon]|jgi:predicted ribosome quality control (RQC) complex YloA/Tae2 family protein|nr:NFACT RNA binding domain-containing protein [Candidatus Woesearchaeota archaeon]
MKIGLYLDKSIEENAGLYYDKAKKIKKKIEGARKALDEGLLKLKKLEKEQKVLEVKEEVVKVKKKWYEKFHWFVSSEGFLVIGGRDATSNEIVVKKHTDSNDLVLHTDMAGSPFFVIKSDGKEIGKDTIKEAADATVSFSRAWKLGLMTTSVFYVTPEQVSKKAQSGEYMSKGAFMIYGKVNYIDNEMSMAVGMFDGAIMAGPVSAVKKNCSKIVVVIQGKDKTSSVAKKIRYLVGGELDDIIRALPAGGVEVKSG